MKTYLVVYEIWYYYKVPVLKGSVLFYAESGTGELTTENGTHYYSRLRSFLIEADSKMGAYNLAKSKFKADENIVHIEEL